MHFSHPIQSDPLWKYKLYCQRTTTIPVRVTFCAPSTKIMLIGIGVFRGTEISRMSYLPMLAMAALGITLAVYSFNYVNKKKPHPHPHPHPHPFLVKRNKIEDDEDGEITMGEHSVDGRVEEDGNGAMDPDIKFMCLTTLDELKYSGKPHDDCNDRLRFMESVDRYLNLYTGRKLKNFTLGCCFFEHISSHLERWMQTIAGLDVEELYLLNPCSNARPFSFSFQLISELSTLRMLFLACCNVQPGFPGEFKSLVTINLQMISFLRDEMSEILLSCPNLENLRFYYCKLPFKSRILGQNLKLKVLRLYFCYGLRELHISAVNLIRIDIDSGICLKVFLTSVPELEYLSFINPGMPYSFGGIQTDLPKLNTLLLQGMVRAVDEIPSVLPTFEMFGNIRNLMLLIKRHRYRYQYQGACTEDDLCTFAPVLSACPLLVTFFLTVERWNYNEERVEWPDLRHKHLEHMELWGFSDKKSDLDFAKFILKSTQVLRRLVLRTSFVYCDDRRCLRECSLDHCPEINERDVQLISKNLQGHALSSTATVEIY